MPRTEQVSATVTVQHATVQFNITGGQNHSLHIAAACRQHALCNKSQQCSGSDARAVAHLEEVAEVSFGQEPEGISLLLAPLELETASLDLLPVSVRLLLQPFGLFQLALC